MRWREYPPESERMLTREKLRIIAYKTIRGPARAHLASICRRSANSIFPAVVHGGGGSARAGPVGTVLREARQRLRGDGITTTC